MYSRVMNPPKLVAIYYFTSNVVWLSSCHLQINITRVITNKLHSNNLNPKHLILNIACNLYDHGNRMEAIEVDLDFIQKRLVFLHTGLLNQGEFSLWLHSVEWIF